MASVTLESGPYTEKPTIGRRHHWWRYASGALALLLTIWALNSVSSNPRFQWSVVREYLFNQSILDGLVVTLELTAIAQTIGIVLGVLIALMLLSRNPVLQAVA